MTEHSIEQSSLSRDGAAEIVSSFMVKVYGWMTAGLFVTALFAMLVADSPSMRSLVYGNRGFFFLLFIGQLGLVIWLSARIKQMTAGTATAVFIAFTALTGITLSSLFMAYTTASIASTFVVTAGTFGATSLYGMATKRDLTSTGSFLFMGLIGIIIASVVNMFLGNETVYWVITYIGIIVFVGLTAYHTQQIKSLAQSSTQGADIEQRAAIIGALTLYLDFINLFVRLMRVLGRRR